MMSIKSIGYAQYGLIVINFLAVLFNASIYLFVPSYVVNKGLSYALLTQLESLPDAPEFIFLDLSYFTVYCYCSCGCANNMVNVLKSLS